MQWFTDLIGWPWYTNWYPLAIGILFFLWLFLRLFRILGNNIPEAKWLRDRRVRWPLALILSCTIVLGDVIQIGRTANQLCREQGGLHVFKTVEAEGFLGSSSIEYWSRYGFKYVEGGGTKGRKFRATIENGKVIDREVPDYISRYQWKGKENHHPLTPRLSRSSSHVIDRQTGEELGTLVWFTIDPGWWDRLVLSLLPGEFNAWVCGQDVPKEQQNLYGQHYYSDDLIKAVIKPAPSNSGE